MVYRGYLASEKPRCGYCGGFVSAAKAQKRRYICPNCKKAVFQYQPEKRIEAE